MKKLLLVFLFVLLSLVSVPSGTSRASTANSIEPLFSSSAPAQRKPYRRYRPYRGPVRAKSAPVGATAQCRDGTYSFSRNRRDTCSWHGGVAAWL
jgi:hypothetical protein